MKNESRTQFENLFKDVTLLGMRLKMFAVEEYDRIETEESRAFWDVVKLLDNVSNVLSMFEDRFLKSLGR